MPASRSLTPISQDAARQPRAGERSSKQDAAAVGDRVIVPAHQHREGPTRRVGIRPVFTAVRMAVQAVRIRTITRSTLSRFPRASSATAPGDRTLWCPCFAKKAAAVISPLLPFVRSPCAGAPTGSGWRLQDRARGRRRHRPAFVQRQADRAGFEAVTESATRPSLGGL